MALTGWGHLFIQTTTPGEDPIRVGSLWADTSGTPVLRICTSVSPYSFTAVGSGSSSSGVDRVVETGTTLTIEDETSVVVAEYFAIEGSGSLLVEGSGALAVI